MTLDVHASRRAHASGLQRDQPPPHIGRGDHFDNWIAKERYEATQANAIAVERRLSTGGRLLREHVLIDEPAERRVRAPALSGPYCLEHVSTSPLERSNFMNGSPLRVRDTDDRRCSGALRPWRRALVPCARLLEDGPEGLVGLRGNQEGLLADGRSE